MGDDFSKKGPPDSARVSLSEDWERRYWARKFGVTEEELRAAVAAVGSQPEELRKHFRYPPR
jgi:hypothetical protein